MGKVVKIKDRNNNQLLPITRSELVEMSNGDSLQIAYNGINSTHYTKAEINNAGYLTSHQSIKTINNQTITGTGNVTINALPVVSSSDNGKVLQVVNGVWTLVSPVTLYSGSSTPNNSQGNNGDLYLQV